MESLFSVSGSPELRSHMDQDRPYEKIWHLAQIRTAFSEGWRELYLGIPPGR